MKTILYGLFAWIVALISIIGLIATFMPIEHSIAATVAVILGVLGIAILVTICNTPEAA